MYIHVYTSFNELLNMVKPCSVLPLLAKKMGSEQVDPIQRLGFRAKRCNSSLRPATPELDSVPPWFRLTWNLWHPPVKTGCLSINKPLTLSMGDLATLVMTQKKLSKYCDPIWTDKAKIGKKLRTWVQDRFFRSMEDEDWPLPFLRVLAILVQADEISFMYQSIFSSWRR